jgi:hypothetical protein
MPYQFGEYVSTYVDPQSVKISETLRNRFIQNFQANDQLAMAVDQMQAALPFEADVQRKKELQRLTENELGKLAEQGDYENLGFAINKTVKDFSQNYAPIKENYDRYSKYLSDFNEGLKKGDYNPEQQKLLGDYMLRTAQGKYKGFEIDPETGRPKEGSLFTGPTIYRDPKIMDRVTQRLQILHEKKTGSTVQKVGQGEGGMYVIEQGGTMSQIPQEDVDKVLAAVMAESDVKAYVDQLADMKTYSFQANGQLPQIFNAQVEGYNNALNQLNSELSSGKLSSRERLQVKSQIVAVTKELDNLKKAAGDENSMYSYIKSKAMDEIERPIREFASLKGGIYEQTSVYKESYDALWLDEYKRQKDFEETYGTPMEEMSEITADLDGKTIDEQLKNAGDKTLLAAELEKEAYDATSGLSPQARQEKLKQAADLKRRANLIEQNIVKAGNMSLSMESLEKADPNIMAVIKEMYPGKTAGEYALILNRTFDNTQDQDYIDFKNAFDKKRPLVNLSTGVKDMYRNVDWDTYVNMTIYDGTSDNFAEASWRAGANGKVEIQDRMGDEIIYEYADMVEAFGKIREKFQINAQHVSDKLPEIKIASPVIYGVLPGVTPEDQRVVTKAADAYFKDKILPANLTVRDQESGQTQSGKDLEAYTTKRYGYDPRTNEWVLTMEGQVGETKDIKTVRLSGSQVSNPIISQWQSAMPTQIAFDVVQHDAGAKGQVREFNRNIIDRNTGERTGSTLTFRVHSQGSGQAPLVEVVDRTGYTYKKRTLSEFTQLPPETDRSVDAQEKRTLYQFINEGYLE